MNSFVLDGAVNRKRRVARQGSSTHRGIDPSRKKIRKTEYDDETTTQCDLRLHVGESTVNQSTSMVHTHCSGGGGDSVKAIETDKESRYSNADFTRAKAFLYLKFKKINPANINKALEEHLKRFDKDGTQLKKIFEQCYDLTKGSVKMSEAMMKQLETNSFTVHLTDVSSRIGDRLFNNSCKEVVKKTVKRNNITKDKKLMPPSLKKRIDDKISILFGNFNLKNDKKILYSNPIFHTVPENDISHDNTCRITKSYSIRTTQNDSIKKTKISKPNANCIVRENNISCINNPVNDDRKIKIPQLKIDGIVQNTEKSVLEIDHNAKDLALETNIGTGEIVVPQLRIDETIQKTKELALEIVDDDDVEEIKSPRLIIDETNESIEESELNISEEITVTQLNMDKCVNNVKDSALEIASDGEEMIPQIRIDETIQNAKELALEIVDDDDVGKIMSPRLIIDETIESIEKSELNISEEITVTQLNMDKCVNNVKDSALEIAGDGEEMIPQIRIDETIQNSKELALEIVDDDDVGEIMSPRLIIDKTIESIEKSELNISEEITVTQLNMDKCVNNVKDSALEIAGDGEEMIPQIRIDETIQNAKELALEIVEDDDVGEIKSPWLIIDETIESIEESELNISEEITVTQLNMDKCVNNVKDSALEIAGDGEEMIPQIRIDETIQNAKELALEIVEDDDVGEIMSPRLIIDETVESIEESELNISEEITVTQLNMDKCVNNVKDSALEIAGDGEEMIPQIRIDETIQNSKELALEIVDDDDVGEIMSPRLIMDGNIENTKSSAFETNIDVINEIENTNDINQQSKILKHFINIVLKIGRLIDPEDEIFKNSIIKDLATYFLNDDFLSKVDILFNTTESDLVGELIVKLLDMFNDSQFNMAPFSGCLISVFREIALKSSIPPCRMKLKLIVFLDAIKKYIRVHDYGLYRSWFLPSMFFDWCFFVAYIFMNTNKDFIIDLNKKSIIKNATLYYNMVKQSRYVFINQGSKPKKTLKKSGIFELTRIDDLLEIDDVHTKKSDNQVIPNISVNILFKKPKHNKLKIKNENENCIETINLTTMAGDEEKECPTPVNYNIYVNPKYNFSNSFLKPLDFWFGSDVTELRNQLNATISNKSNESSNVVQNNTTNVDNNIQPIANNFVSGGTCVKNKSRKRKKSTQVESPRVYFTVANNPKQFNLTFGSSVVTQSSSSSRDPQNTSLLTIPQTASQSRDPQITNLSKVSPSSRSSTNLQNTSCLEIPQSSKSSKAPRKTRSPKNLRKLSSSTIPQNEGLLTIPQNSYSMTVSQNSSSLTFPQYTNSSTVPTNRSSYSNNNLTNTQYQETFQTVIRQNPYSSTVPQNTSLLTIPQNPYSPTVHENSCSLTMPQYSSSSTVSHNASLLTIPQNPHSPTVHQNSSSLTFPQRSRSSAVSQRPRSLAVPQCPTLLTMLQNPHSPIAPQNSSSLTFPQYSSSLTVPSNQSSYYNNILSNTQYPESLQTVIPQNPYSPTVHQNSSSLTMPQHLSPYYNNFSSNHTQIPIGFRKDSSISNTTQTSKSKSTSLPVNNDLQSSITTKPPDSSNKWPENLYHQSSTMNALCSMMANTYSSNASNTSNVNKNPCFGNSCRHYAHYTPYTGFIQSHKQSLYNENIPFTTSQHSNAPTCITNHMEPISRDVAENTQTIEASINNAYIQQLNDKYNNINHGSSLVNQNNLQTPEYNSQVSPDLPDARLPNMPNLQDSNTRNKTCMAANCTNISCFRCETCTAAFYCSIQCQTTDLHYHKNECQRF
ncbi:hypothetical protein AGLY_001467 [Aphis glycines]|uniref:MYND-type domain-containing protein n=1 Tax=Aphis glycines TaxID=307491 RepID=A0A6G0U595_APHGL|nr:hypothetical protein AGLY_001467 [Aphis glycines]